MGRREVGEVGLTNCIIVGDAFSTLFVSTIDPLIKFIKKRLLKEPRSWTIVVLNASIDIIETAERNHDIVKTYDEAIGMIVNN